tara:strand:+ start:586 stop:1653 length:1068 start_codon:yes stop_codon:yes gene_type:complete
MIKKEDIENSIDWNFFYELLSTYLPSNYEENSIIFLKNKLKEYGLKGEYTLGGDVTVNMEGRKEVNVLLDAHLDEIHQRVVNISDEGYLVAKPFGTIVEFLLGKRVVVHGRKEVLNGVIIIPPAHFIKEKMSELNEINNMLKEKYLWIDIGTKSKEESEKFVSIGDAVTFPIEINELKNNCIVSKGLDNRIGAFALSQVLKILGENGNSFGLPNIIANFSNREEVGHGVYLREENMNLDYIIVLDTNIDTSTPVAKSAQYTVVEIGKGPIICKNLETTPKTAEDLEDLCKKINIPYQTSFNTHLGGTNLFGYRKYDTETIFTGVGIRNIHSSVETCKKEDITDLIVLVCNYLLGL